MSDDVLRAIGNLEGKLDHFCDRLERHDHAIYGNGNEGLTVRMDRNERAMRELRKSRKSFWSAVLSVAGAAATGIASLLHMNK